MYVGLYVNIYKEPHIIIEIKIRQVHTSSYELNKMLLNNNLLQYYFVIK